MKKITIPNCKNPFVVILNGIKYEYEAGAEVEVPADVAKIIEMHDERMHKVQPIIGGGGICNRPHVYLLDDSAKLPTDAVDGSLAVVTETSGAEIWVLNDTPDLSPLTEDDMLMTFTSDGNSGVSDVIYEGIRLYHPGSTSWGINALMYSYGDGGVSVYHDNPSNNYGITHGWQDEGYKTIVIYDATETAKAWVEANGRCTGYVSVSTLYSRENGEWVSLGEVDFTNLSSS